jgi:hypothetical protein
MSSVYRQPDDLWWADAVVTGPARQWQSWWQRQWHLVGGSPPGRLARQQGFVVATWQLPAFGWQPHDLRREIRRGQWSSPAFGVASPIVVGATGEYLDRRREHVLAAAGGVLLRRDHVISARSAAIAAGLPTLSVPRRPELTELARETLGRRSRAHVFGAGLDPADVETWFGAPITPTARTVVDLARHDRRDGLMAADAALRERLVEVRDIEAVLADQMGWPGVRRARELLKLATPLAESPLESLTRLALHDDGFPEPELQVVIEDPARGWKYRADMLLREHALILELDGLAKYDGDALRREKVRETRLRWLGYRVVRLLWEDVVYDWPITRNRLWAVIRS